MSSRTVSRRYARALYEEADRTGRVETIDDDIETIRQSLKDSEELDRFFRSPAIPKNKKEDVVKALFEDRVDGLMLRFLRLLIEKDREDMVQEITDQYQDMRDEQRGIVEAKARVARALGDAEHDRLVRALEDMTGKKVRLLVSEDPELIGGLVVRIGDQVYDGSVRHKLAALRERLHGGRVSTNGAANGQAAGG